MGKKKEKKAKKVKPKPIAKPKPQTKSTKGRKKKWYTILASKSFRESPIGECHVYEPGVLVDRVVDVNLMSLLGDFKKQNMSLSFKIKKVRGDNALTEPYALKTSPTSLKRLVRRGRDRCDYTLQIDTADKAKVLIKLIFLTRNNTTKSVSTALRKNAEVFLKQYAKSKTLDNLMLEAVHGKLQKVLKDAQKKIYPLRSCEVKLLKVTGEATPQPAPVEQKPDEAIEPKEEKQAKAENKDKDSKKKSTVKAKKTDQTKKKESKKDK